ncbi:hypothetical protein FA13DRAFT_1394738 [Coprinellus micaceus]|uniref:F-box domain-containing protein n=1 Tax=Coprinellus micaceus TaxID=71717 RepID=A0A4Y7SPV5_COPMI|nr:hypothetical protein FA13DRAFT_1394738 [Coprinellus micaceus]
MISGSSAYRACARRPVFWKRSAGYEDLPLELRLIILSYCGKGQLAALSSAKSAVGDEAEHMLYNTISLTHTRPLELESCLSTLISSKRKAKLVESLAFSIRSSTEKALSLIPRFAWALENTTSLDFLSCRVNDLSYSSRQTFVDALERRTFSLSALYISAIPITLGVLIQYQPELEIIGFWDCDNHDYGDIVELFWKTETKFLSAVPISHPAIGPTPSSSA